MGNPSSSLFIIFFLIITGSVSTNDQAIFRPTKLFVFGDSYADTGNLPKVPGSAWRTPYGITLPGKPAGRFSDGLILTDYLAKSLRIKTPVGYRWEKSLPRKYYSDGMNFAFGGSGVFFTLPNLPNMTTQIDFFENLLTASFYTKSNLESAAVLVTCSGNDYATRLANNGSIADVKNFIPRVVNQLVANLRRIQRLGAKKIIVGGLQPLGCLPRITQMNGYKNCIEPVNVLVEYHDALLQAALEKLNNGGGVKTSTFFFLDLYQAFQTVILNKRDYRGELKFVAPLTPCCVGTGSGNSCGSVDGNGTALYTVCSDRSSAFFWDGSHPTHAGWMTMFALVHKSILNFL